MWRVSGDTNILGEVSGCLSEWFWKVMSERVHLKVLYFLYFMALYTNQGAWGDKGGIRGVGVHPSSQIFIIIFPWVSLV